MHEQSKAAKRRFSDGAFHTRYFVGNGIDIGGKPDPLGQYASVFGRMGSVSVWDLENGDAQKMAGVADASYDFVHSSHCLEHMNDVSEAMKNWVRIVKPGGFLIITVPDEDLYENGQWPSRYNSDHKWSFTIQKNNSKLPRSINVTDLLSELNHLVEIERIVLVRDFFQDALAGRMDQTLSPVAECVIEFVLRKRTNPDVVGFRKVSAQQEPTTALGSNFNPARPQPAESTDELYKEAISFVNSNKLDEAVQALEALVAKTSDDALAHNDLGVLYQKKGDFQKSRQHHQIAAQLQPANEIFQKNLADLLCSGFGELEEALNIYVKLYAQNCYDIETIKAIAHICLEVDKPDDARFFLEKVLEIKPWDQEAAEALRALKADI